MSKSWPISVFSLICASFFVIHIVTALPTRNNLTDSSSSQQKRARQDDSDLDTEGGEGGEGGIIDVEAVVGGGEAPSAVYLMSTYQNVQNILTGVVNRNLTNILSGGTGFIPQGGLRNSVDFLVQQALIPNVQRVITDLQGSFNQSETTPSAFTPDLQSAAALASASHQTPQDIYRVPNQPRIETIPGSGAETTEEESFFSNPIKALQNRLQGFLPIFGSSSSNNNKNTNNNLNNNVRVNNANIASPPRVINVVNVNNNANRQRIPSPVRPNIPSSAVAS